MSSVVVRSADREGVEKAVREHACDLRRLFPEIERILWFGSWTRGIPLPASDVDLCLILSSSPHPPQWHLFVSAPNFEDWRAHQTRFRDLAVWEHASFNLVGAVEPIRVRAARVTSGFFAVMGVHPSRESHRRPARGGLRRDVAVSFEVRGQVPLAGGRLSARLRAVTPGLFQTLDIRLVRGRPFQESDSLHSLPVAIIDRDLAERLWPHSDALGHRLELWKQRTIVGVVEGIRTSGPRSEHRPMIYVPFQQHPSSQINFVIKTGGKPLGIAAQVKKEMKRLDPGQPLFGLQSMEEALSISVARDRFQGLLMALFGVSGLLLSCIGLYGVLAFNVTQRTPEMGVRMALGARPRDVFRLVVGQGIGLLLAGLAIGNLVSLGSTRLLSSLLYGVGTMDAGMFIAASLTLLLAGVLASAIPARRAARLDPASALRFE